MGLIHVLDLFLGAILGAGLVTLAKIALENEKENEDDDKM